MEYAGAVYHVVSRGDRKEPIFGSDGDRRMMLETLAEICERTGFIIHSYVLMPNHYHFLLETPEPNLVRGMKWFQGTYTQRYNARNGLHGHVFQGRYKAIPVDADQPEYFRRISDYIHLNPARARLLSAGHPALERFEWSSFPAFIHAGGLPPWLCRRRVFACHGWADEGAASRRKYKTLLHEKMRQTLGVGGRSEELDVWKKIRRGWYWGGDTFRDALMDRMDRAVAGRRRESYGTEGMRLHDERAAERLLGQACALLSVAPEDLRRWAKNDAAKQAIAWWVKSRTVVGDEWLCSRLGMGSRVNVSRAVCAYRDPQDADRIRLKNMFEKEPSISL